MKAYGFRRRDRAVLVLFLLFPLLLLLEKDLVTLLPREDGRACLPEEALLLPLSCQRLLRADPVGVPLDFDRPDWDATALPLATPDSGPSPVKGLLVRNGTAGKLLSDS